MQEHEWLSVAQSLPVGMSKRIYHGAEHRPNLVVRNLPDKWTAYCFACKEYAEKHKDFVRILEEVQPSNQVDDNIGSLVSLDDPKAMYLAPMHDIALFLHKKHMSISLLSPYNPAWDYTHKRLTLTLPSGLIGRDIYGRSSIKWYVYYNAINYGSANGSNELNKDTLVLTEDFLSAIKLQRYCPDYQVIALLGTSLPKALERALIASKPSMVYMFLDGDEAGWRGTTKILRHIQCLGINAVDVSLESGDPRELSGAEIIDRLCYSQSLT